MKKNFLDNNKNGKRINSLRLFNGYIQNEKRQIPKYLLFRCGLTHLNCSLTKFSKTFNLQKELLKTKMNHGEINADNWEV